MPRQSAIHLKLPSSNYSLFKLISAYLSNNAVTSKTLEIDRQGFVILDICLLLHSPVTINSTLNYVFELLMFLSSTEAYPLGAFCSNFYHFTLPNLYRKIWHLL